MESQRDTRGKPFVPRVRNTHPACICRSAAQRARTAARKQLVREVCRDCPERVIERVWARVRGKFSDSFYTFERIAAERDRIAPPVVKRSSVQRMFTTLEEQIPVLVSCEAEAKKSYSASEMQVVLGKLQAAAVAIKAGVSLAICDLQGPHPRIQKESAECILCAEAVVQRAFIPCGHAPLCDKCYEAQKQQMQKCPICRTAVENTMRIYL